MTMASTLSFLLVWLVGYRFIVIWKQTEEAGSSFRGDKMDVDFFRSWTEYQSGFGTLSGEFWLGNDILQYLTKTGQWQLRIDMADWYYDSCIMTVVLWQWYYDSGIMTVVLWQWYYDSGIMTVVLWQSYYDSCIMSGIMTVVLWQWYYDSIMTVVLWQCRIMTVVLWQWYYDSGIMTVVLWQLYYEWYYDSRIMTVVLWQWYYDSRIMTVVLWQSYYDSRIMTVVLWQSVTQENCIICYLIQPPNYWKACLKHGLFRQAHQGSGTISTNNFGTQSQLHNSVNLGSFNGHLCTYFGHRLLLFLTFVLRASDS